MKIIIFGNRQNAELAKFYLTKELNLTVYAFCVDGQFIQEATFDGLPVLPLEEINLDKNQTKFFCPLADNKLREKKYKEIKLKGYEFLSYISPKCTNYSSSIGDNCFILENNVIQPGVKIFDNNILWSGNHIGHHTTIYASCFIASHVVICGNCTIGKYSWIGVNVAIKEFTTLSEETVVGMGSLILKDTEKSSLYFGSPATKRTYVD